MKLVVIFCLTAVFYMDSVAGMTINEFLSYIPGWNAIATVWEQITAAIKRPVHVRRWEQAIKRKTTTTTPPNTTTTIRMTTSRTSFRILKTTTSGRRASKINSSTSKSKMTHSMTTPLYQNSTTNLSSLPSVHKSVVPVIIPSPSVNRLLTSSIKTLLSPVELPTTPVKPTLSTAASITGDKSLLSGRRKYTRTKKVTIPTINIPTSIGLIPLTPTTALVRRSSRNALKYFKKYTLSINPIFATEPPDMVSRYVTTETIPIEAKVTIPYITNPDFKTVEYWKNLQAMMRFPSPLKAQDPDNATTKSQTTDDTTVEGKELNKEKSFGSLIFK